MPANTTEGEKSQSKNSPKYQHNSGKHNSEREHWSQGLEKPEVSITLNGTKRSGDPKKTTEKPALESNVVNTSTNISSTNLKKNLHQKDSSNNSENPNTKSPTKSNVSLNNGSPSKKKDKRNHHSNIEKCTTCEKLQGILQPLAPKKINKTNVHF